MLPSQKKRERARKATRNETKLQQIARAELLDSAAGNYAALFRRVQAKYEGKQLKGGEKEKEKGD